MFDAPEDSQDMGCFRFVGAADLLSGCHTCTFRLLRQYLVFSYPGADGLVVSLAVCLRYAEEPIDHLQHG